MDLATLSGVYENSKKILRIIGHDQNVTQLSQRLKVLAENPHPNTVAELVTLARALDALEQHLRVLGLEEIVKVNL
jgi:streptomycin 6-kinase